MNEKEQRLNNRLGPELAEFKQKLLSLQLATMGEDGFPHCSYSPFLYHDKQFYILISDISKHAHYLRAHPKAAIMLVEDEAETKQIYARKRLTYDVLAEEISDETREPILDEMAKRHGEIIGGLRQLQDFSLFALTPQSGRYVKGFGQAFDINGVDEAGFVHLKEGHKKRA